MIYDPNEHRLDEVIQQLIQTFRLEGKLKEAEIIASWEELVGPTIAGHTVGIKIYHKKLFVEVDSAALRNELVYAREKLKQLINQKVGENFIEDIIIR